MMKAAKMTDKIKVRELTTKDWLLLKKLFGSKGACGGCWCMHWRRPKGGKAWEEAKGEPNRKLFKKLVTSGEAFGIIALNGNNPVGWCSFGKRVDFPRLDRTKAYIHEKPVKSEIWSINCIFLDKEYRGIGLSFQMVEMAIKGIQKRKGEIIEAYPVTLTKEGKKLPAAFSFTGPEIIYQRLGFKEIQRLAQSRPLYQLVVK